MTETGRTATGVDDTFTVRKLDYSAGPWRIICPDGAQLAWTETFDHPVSGPMPLQRSGFPTKTAALDALHRYAWQLHQAGKTEDDQ